MKKIPALFFILLVISSCHSKKDYDKLFSDPILYCKTVYELNNVVMGNNFSPIVASRNYMYANVAAYEVIAAGYPTQYNSLAGQITGLKSVPAAPAGITIDYHLASLLAFCKLGESVTFPAGSMSLYVDSLKKLAVDHGMPDDILKNTLAFSDTVSAVIMKWSRKDYYLETRGAPEYNVNDSPGRWVPTPPAYAPAAEPHWKEIRELAIDSINQFLPPPPYHFDVTHPQSDYYKEVKKIQNRVDSLTEEQTFIADFWDDNPFKLNVSGHLMFGTKKFSPGGHWMSITGIAAQKSGADFPTTVCAYAKTAIALFDTFIQCWNIKYLYNTVRPETVVNRYFDPNWRPHLQTPPFPEYTCGHCYISASAAEALTSVFGDHFAYTDTTEMDFGIGKRSYASFRDAASETAHSRFYGGIHFDYSTAASHEMGMKIGQYIAGKLKMKK
jgi:hypothetical protein